MPLSYAEYKLQHGFIDNWLVAGPQVTRISAPVRAGDPAGLLEVARQFHQPESGVNKAPVEQGPLTEGILKIGSFESVWKYTACGQDHFVHLSYASNQWQFARAWAYSQLFATQPQELHASVTAFGPVDVYLNKQLVYTNSDFAPDQPETRKLTLSLRKGKNDLIVRFANAGAGDIPLAVSFQLEQPADTLIVRIPTLTKSLTRRNELERVNQYAYAERDVFGPRQMMRLFWPEDMPEAAFTTVRIQTPARRIYGETEADGKPGEIISYLNSSQLLDGRYHFFLMPRPWEFYESDIRMTRTLEAMVVSNSPASAEPYGDLDSRRVECLDYAARFENNLFGAIARHALNRWENSDTQFVQTEIDRISQQDLPDYLAVVGLFGLRLRSAGDPGSLEALLQPLDQMIKSLPYMDSAAEQADNRQILAASCAILAGQLFPDHAFASGLSGSQLREQTAGSVLAWMQQRGTHGFADWDSPAVYAETITALSMLIDFAEDEQVWELASVLLDKLFFTLAANSFQGIFASARRSASVWAARSGLMEETAGVSRLMWGMGLFNPHLAAPVSLALMEKYDLPPIFAQIAAYPAPLWSRMRSAVGTENVNKTAYRTKDYLLSSAQDYRAGTNGSLEQVWLASLGPNSQVFTNHPAYSVDQDGLAPGYWRGNGALPRVAQWKDALVALYRLPEDDRFGFTHAHFPTASFDEYVLRGGWAFARVSEGYLALTASQEISLVRHGALAYRELRAAGSQVAWVCQLGSSEQDGSFEQFQEKVLAMKCEFNGLTARLETLRGDQLAIGWDSPFELNGQEQPLADFPHFENDFCSIPFGSEEMEMRTSDYALRLDFRSTLKPTEDNEASGA